MIGLTYRRTVAIGASLNGKAHIQTSPRSAEVCSETMFMKPNHLSVLLFSGLAYAEGLTQVNPFNTPSGPAGAGLASKPATFVPEQQLAPWISPARRSRSSTWRLPVHIERYTRESGGARLRGAGDLANYGLTCSHPSRMCYPMWVLEPLWACGSSRPLRNRRGSELSRAQLFQAINAQSGRPAASAELCRATGRLHPSSRRSKRQSPIGRVAA